MNRVIAGMKKFYGLVPVFSLWIGGAAALTILAAGCGTAGTAGSKKGVSMVDDQGFYLCAMTQDASGGIYRYKLNAEGQPVKLAYSPLTGSNYLAYSLDRQMLYSTCIIDGAGGAAAFRIRADHSLEFINQLPSCGKSTCYIVAAPGGKFLYTANYSAANISEFALRADGGIEKLVRTIDFTGHGALPRQTEPHPHFVNFTPDGKYLIVIDLGLDAIKLFGFDPERGLLDVEHPYVFQVEPAGSGPRHLVFNAAGDRAYLLNEIGNTVITLKYENGTLDFMQLLPTLPAGFHEYSKAAAIRLSPDERFLYASNRGYDTVACYAVNADGTLSFRALTPTHGTSPRDINFLPGGRAFAAANEFSDVVVFFGVDPDDGKLSASGQTVTLPRPLAIYW